MDQATLWDTARARIRDELGWLRSATWLDDVRLRDLEQGVVTLEASAPQVRDQTLGHETTVRQALEAVLGQRVTLRVSLARRGRGRPRKRAASANEPELRLEPEVVHKKLQLSSYVAGPKTELPLRFARQTVEAPNRWNPLVFYGASGNGKTHLLHGIVNAYRRRYPGRRTVYVTGDRFARQYSITSRRRLGDRFRQFYRRADLLVIDDLQGIAGKRGTERELCFTLDHLITAKKQVVLAASAPPKRLAQLQRGLEGRLLSGLVVGIEGSDRDTRREVIRARSLASQLELSDPVVELLVSGFGDSMRELLSALTRLEAHRRHIGSRLGLDTVRELLADLLQQTVRPASLEGLADFVAERLQTPVEDQRGKSRKAAAVRARQLAMALARELTPFTLREIGAFFGRSCGSVHMAHGRFSELKSSDAEVREIWESACGLFTRPQ